MLQPDRSTTKTRLVFDVSAKFNGMSLNVIVLQGPKLRNDLCAVLLWMWHDPGFNVRHERNVPADQAETRRLTVSSLFMATFRDRPRT